MSRIIFIVRIANRCFVVLPLPIIFSGQKNKIFSNLATKLNNRYHSECVNTWAGEE